MQTAPARGKTALRAKQLYDALIEHGVRDFYESGDVCTNDKIARLAVFIGSFPCRLEDRRHDVAQARINFFARPRQTHGILAHFKPRGCYTAGIRRFARTEENLFLKEKIHSRWHDRH